MHGFVLSKGIVMSVSVFQAAILINSVVETTWGSGIYTMDFQVTDHEGIYLGTDVQVGDAIILDTSGIDTGTMSRYTITSIASKTVYNVVAQVQYDASNGGISPDLANYDLTFPGLVTRKTTNYSLLNLPSLQIQQLSDKFAFNLINYMNNDIVDNITGGGGDVVQVLTNATPTPTTIGGIPAGTTFNSIPVETVLQNLLYPYQTPAFTSFSISGQTSPLEVGGSVSGGSKTFTWATSNSSNVAANSISIIDVTNSNTTLGSSLANTGSTSISISSVTKTTATTHQWKIQATNTQSGVFSNTYTVTWQWRRFYGESSNTALIASEIQTLRVSALASGFAGTYSFNAGGYKYIAYPASFGTATSFKDQSTNLDVPFQTVQVISITNTNGITTNYNVHRTTNILGSAINIVVA